jgi:hypothetical protein
MIAVRAKLDLVNLLLMPFHPLEQFARFGVPQTNVMADVTEDPLPVVVPTPTRSFDALFPLDPFRGDRLAGCINARDEESDDGKAECQHLS